MSKALKALNYNVALYIYIMKELFRTHSSLHHLYILRFCLFSMYIFLKVTHLVKIYGVENIFHTKLTGTAPIPFSLSVPLGGGTAWEEGRGGGSCFEELFNTCKVNTANWMIPDRSVMIK